MAGTLRNLRSGAVLATDIQTASSFWEKFRGLLGQDSLPEGRGLYIVPCQSIHSFFMRFPFDAVFIDRGHRVVHSIHAMPAFRMSRHVFSAHGVVELPAGVLAATHTEHGDQLAFD